MLSSQQPKTRVLQGSLAASSRGWRLSAYLGIHIDDANGVSAVSIGGLGLGSRRTPRLQRSLVGKGRLQQLQSLPLRKAAA